MTISRALWATALLLAVGAIASPATSAKEPSVASQKQVGGRPQQSVPEAQLSEAERQGCLLQRFIVRRAIRTAMNSNTRLIPGFIRATFHDCITVTPDKPDSGCNGSLRLTEEITNPNNARLSLVTNELEGILASTTCVSFADAIQIGVEVASNLAGLPMFPGFLGRGRTDAGTPDTVNGELPSPIATFAELKAFYERKGFTVRDLVVSSVGGHAVGRFLARSGAEFPFTPNELVIDNGYAINLLDGILAGQTNLPGFNTLPSDRSLVEDEAARFWLGFYAGRGSRGGFTRLGNRRLRKDFRIFLRKLASL